MVSTEHILKVTNTVKLSILSTVKFSIKTNPKIARKDQLVLTLFMSFFFSSNETKKTVKKLFLCI